MLSPRDVLKLTIERAEIFYLCAKAKGMDDPVVRIEVTGSEDGRKATVDAVPRARMAALLTGRHPAGVIMQEKPTPEGRYHIVMFHPRAIAMFFRDAPTG